MATYPYLCAACGPFEVARPIGTAESVARCGGCGDPARRVYTPPLLGRTQAPVKWLHDAAARSADQPSVVNRVPSARSRPGPAADPRQALLPRP